MGERGGSQLRGQHQALITTKNISLSTAKTEGAVVQVLKDWATAYPDELVAFKSQMAQHRWGLVDTRGMSRAGNMREIGQIPVTLNLRMIQSFGKLWSRDRILMNYFWDHFRVGRAYVAAHHSLSRVE